MPIRRGIPVRIIGCLALLLAGPALAQDPGLTLPVNEEDVLVLEVRADRYLASEGLIGYRHGDQVLLPLGELAAVLEYALVSAPAAGVVEGWLLDEDHVFRLDLGSRSVTVGGRQTGIDQPCLHVDDHDIYATSDVLSSWWPLELEIDLSRLQVTVRSREPVPLVSRLDREREWAQMDSDGHGDDPEYPLRQARYRLASWPFLDATVSLDARESETDWRGSILARGDLARLSTTGFVSQDSRKQDAWYAWLRAGRDDHRGGLLGPLGATSFAIGDVVSPSLALAASSLRGRGLRVTNRPLGSTTQFDAVDINGEAPPGWQIELYVDGTLRAIQTASPEGYYEFADVPLHLGLNTARVVMYGPNGQQREDVFTYNIRSGMSRRGELNYDLASLQPGLSLLGQGAERLSGHDRDDWHHQAEMRYGLDAVTTVGAAVSASRGEDGHREVVLASVLRSLGPFFLRAVGAKDLAAGYAGKLGVQARLGGRSLYLDYERHDDFDGFRSDDPHPSERRISARLDGLLGHRRQSALSYRLRWERDDPVDPELGTEDTYAMHLSGGLAGLHLGNELEHRRWSSPTSAATTVGQLVVAGARSGIRLRGMAAYRLDEGARWHGLGATASYHFTTRLRGQLSGMRVFTTPESESWLARLDWDLAPVRLGFQGGVADGAWSAGLTASTSLAASPQRGTWTVSGRRLSRHGAALVRAFVDADRDGAFGAGDEPLEDVGFAGNYHWRDIRTAEDGQAFLPGLPADRFSSVRLDVATVADPYLVPLHEGMATMVHAGGVSDLEFPFQYVGELEGMVGADVDLSRPLRNVGLELVDGNGERETSTVSEFDGYYLFQNVAPGEYQLRVVENTLRGRAYRVPPPATVVIPPHGGYVMGPDVILEPETRAEEEILALHQDEPADPEEPSAPPEEPRAAEPAPDENVRVAAESPRPIAEEARDPIAMDRTGRTAPATSPPEDPSARDLRSLQLIYELLYDSTMFSGTSR